MTTKRRFSLVLILTFLLGGWWIWQHRLPTDITASARPAIPRAGNPAPDFSLLNPAGNEISLSGLKGQAVVLNFWASWCGPCRAEMPELQQVYHQFGKKGLVVLGVNQGEPVSIVNDFLAQLQLTFPVVLDQQLQVSQLYHVNSLPTTFFIDGDGIIREVVIGQMNAALLKERLRSIYP